MNRAVVVLLLLIANAIVANRNLGPRDPAPPRRPDYSLGVFATIDGAALRVPPGTDECPVERMRRKPAAMPEAFDDIRL